MARVVKRGRVRRGGAGMGVDASGDPVIDPTKNVLDKVEDAVRRIDDMMELRALIMDEKINRMEREWIHLDKLSTIRAEYEGLLRHAEAARLDSIRQVDREDVSKTAMAANTAIATLAKQTTDLAITLQRQVTDTATAAEARYSAQYGDTNKRLSALELSSSEGRGKQAVSDPQMERLSQLVERLATTQDKGSGKSAGISMAWVALLGLVSLLGGLAGLGGLAFGLIRMMAK